jgi:intein/homing endonuclease
MGPAADCIFLGEAEDEPGNGGLSQVCARIAQFKDEGIWKADRVECYRRLAREFSYLFFPRFVQTFYRYEDRGLPELSRQVSGYRSLLDGMRMPFRGRTVRNLDDIAPLTEAPLLYADPRMGAGDLEVGRGCVGEDEYVFLPGRGIQRLGDFAGDMMHPAGLDAAVRRDAARVSHVLDNGQRAVVRVQTRQGHAITCTPDHRIWTDRGWVEAQFLVPGDKLPVYYGQRAFGPEQDLDATQSALLASANYRHPVDGQRSGNRANQLTVPGKLTPELAWLLGFLTGDGGIYGDGKCVFFMTRTEEPEVAEFVHRWMLGLFGLSPVVRTRPGVPVLYHFYFSQPLVRWLRGNFGYSCGKGTEQSKLYVPEKVLQSPRNVQESYLLGLFEADLYCAGRPKGPKFSTISERLARQVSAMLLNLGVPCSFHPKVRASVKGRGGTDWEILFHRAGDAYTGWLRLLAQWKDDQLSWYRSAEVVQGSKFHLRRDYVPAVVKDVTSLEATARVLDLHAPAQEAFNASGFVVHNCDAWCSFCALGWNANPPRERSVEKSVEHAQAWQRNMGSTELSPFSPDFPMHRQKKRLLAALLEKVNSSLDVTAMRIDDFIEDDQYMLIQARAGADGVTLGLEGNSQRMRDLVGKGTADKDVEEAVTRGIRAGFRKFKLFMITNFPGEEPGDVMRIVELGRRLAAIRDELAQPRVVFQFSWTPLLIESQTPFQWFAPTPADHTLIHVAEEFRELGIQFKVGTKAEVNKVSLFQLCQRASREVGEAITDVIEELDTACWGGVPKDTRDRLEAALRRRGFRNGLADCFDERFAGDLFGWEYISMGVSFERMWDAYDRMREFLEGTDADTYESQFSGPAGGNEWVARCDQQCGGNACGVCDGEDLKLRSARIRAGDASVDMARLKVIDQDSVAFRIRARLEIPPGNRFVTRAHWVYAIRRAAYRAQHDVDWKTGIAKKTVRLASEACRHRDWACGTDYAEFGLTWRPPADELFAFMRNMAAELEPWMVFAGLDREDWSFYAAAADVRRDAGLALWELEPPAGPDEVAARIAWFAEQDYVKLVIRSDSAYFAAGTEEVNAKDWVSDMWLARDGHASRLRMLVSAKAGQYSLYAALAGKPSWIAAAAKPAVRLGVFSAAGDGDLLRPSCGDCGEVIPVGLLDEPYSTDRCPRCADEAAGIVVAGLKSRAYS